MITVLGEMSIGAAVPAAAAASIAGAAGINTGAAELQTQLDGLLAFPPAAVDFTAQLQMANDIVSAVSAAITLGIPVPDMAAAIAAQIAALTAQLATLSAELGICVDLGTGLAVGGLRLYAYEGPVGALALELGAELGPDPSPSHALILLTTDPACWDAMSAIFKVSP